MNAFVTCHSCTPGKQQRRHRPQCEIYEILLNLTNIIITTRRKNLKFYQGCNLKIMVLATKKVNLTPYTKSTHWREQHI